MSATVLYMSMSLDGFIAGPNVRPVNGLGDGEICGLEVGLDSTRAVNRPYAVLGVDRKADRRASHPVIRERPGPEGIDLEDGRLRSRFTGLGSGLGWWGERYWRLVKDRGSNQYQSDRHRSCHGVLPFRIDAANYITSPIGRSLAGAGRHDL